MGFSAIKKPEIIVQIAKSLYDIRAHTKKPFTRKPLGISGILYAARYPGQAGIF